MSDTAGRADVVVIGAGFSGLSAGLVLVEAGVDVIVLEARDTVGGRVRSALNGLGERVDTGGQFFCEDMPEVMALARRYGMRSIQSRMDGEFLSQPTVESGEDARIYAGSTAIRARMNRLDPGDPAIADVSVAAWLERQRDADDVKAAFRSMIEGLWCIATDRLPLWYLIDNDRRITNEAPELQYFLAGTLHALAERLAGELGGRIRLATQAKTIHHAADGVRVETGTGVIEAHAAIVAAPPVMASRLPYRPALPPPLAQALSVWESGAVIKALIRYDRAFWRDSGHSGMVAWRDPPSLFVFDASPDADHPMLAFFAGGPQALALRAQGELAIRAEILGRLAAALGPRAGSPSDLLLLDWTHDQWSGGAYSDLVVEMHATDAEDILRAGLARVAFACSELSPSFPGYIEGAIIAGRAAAGRILAGIARSRGE